MTASSLAMAQVCAAPASRALKLPEGASVAPLLIQSHEPRPVCSHNSLASALSVSPQQAMVSSLRIAHVCIPPAATAL